MPRLRSCWDHHPHVAHTPRTPNLCVTTVRRDPHGSLRVPVLLVVPAPVRPVAGAALYRAGEQQRPALGQIVVLGIVRFLVAGEGAHAAHVSRPASPPASCRTSPSWTWGPRRRWFPCCGWRRRPSWPSSRRTPSSCCP